MIRLIGIDVDGTLLDSRGSIPEANLRAVHEAVAAGVHVALVTGRSYPSVRPLADALPETVTLMVSNGAVERRMDGETLVRRLLDRRVARGVLDATPGHRSAAALVFDRDDRRQILFETMDWTHPARQEYWFRNQQLIDYAAPLEDSLTEDPIEVMFNGAVAEMRELSEALARDARGFSVVLTEYPDRDFSLVDVTAPKATKGYALAWRATALGVTPEEVMAVGDNYNDVGMLEFAGVPVVMANAAPSLKERGWHVAPSHDEAGVADAITRLALATSADC
jgi:Cof subfamily protein (haloacid dehalogenase superfamily)